jgi:hypothetical protein
MFREGESEASRPASDLEHIAVRRQAGELNERNGEVLRPAAEEALIRFAVTRAVARHLVRHVDVSGNCDHHVC